MPAHILHCEDAAGVARRTASAVAETLIDAVELRGYATLALTGGSTGHRITAALANMAHDISWDDVHVWWGDERFLPAGHPDRNDTDGLAALAPLLTPFGATPVVHRWPAARTDHPGLPEAVHAASIAASDLLTTTGSNDTPRFDAIVLGIGEDAHVASIFPDDLADAITDASWTRAVGDSPKPPPVRLTFGLPILTAARHVWLATAGGAKRNAVAAGLAQADADTKAATTPVGYVAARVDACTWVLDAAAIP